LIEKLDHLVIAVSDLDSAVESYTKLFGYGPSWRGVHEQLGTANALFPVENTYLELLASNGNEGAGAAMIKATLELNGEGLAGLVLGTSNIQDLKESLLESGVELQDLALGEGVDSDQGLKRTWKNLFLPFSLTRGMFAFIIQHESGELPSVHGRTSSTINKLDHVVVNTNDPEGFKSLYGDTFGIRLALDQTVEKWGGRMLFFRLNHTTIEVIGKPDEDDPADKLWGLAWSVEDLKATHQRLVKEGLEISEVKAGRKENTLVCSVKSDTCNVPTLLIQHLS
jgi:catechol 2,3-dioxygenase-like lactoylglutathione lyase family enzyme|tara:strand:+ start:410 stop:1255 length:846 start_codon:yes stop_codon:yes gene_type:complete